MLSKIINCTSVSIHIRRGDFLHPENFSKYGKVCTLNYFHSAINLIRSKIKNPHFFIFSNDIPWAEEHFKGNEFTYLDFNHKENSWKDMFLISKCKHNICSNSTLSWWSAWLNKNEEKIVIVPKQFISDRYFEDIYPQSWIKLDKY